MKNIALALALALTSCGTVGDPAPGGSKPGGTTPGGNPNPGMMLPPDVDKEEQAIGGSRLQPVVAKGADGSSYTMNGFFFDKMKGERCSARPGPGADSARGDWYCVPISLWSTPLTAEIAATLVRFTLEP